ncbi:glutathione S-transferase family protein [Mesorhizobium sp. BR1-1-16]|uniref:glutathione S-transferase family protein n=1 Tax=Mesorhizobium sp. BR1-1-16 TaxID=2876653 RepID=UPI001CCACC1B|nr:glutathione S-transferase family protein [Mesorhizobium sp. BR1-1-16]MBZ9938280.1 glutathione S-transferase family protein [Mesorhizobium sp. BR1-1-16]
MFLIGQYDSPFVRRVGIALRLYDLEFEHRPWSTFSDAEKIAVYNPLRRVPTLVLDSGEVLIESAAILDYLDEEVGPERALIADHGPDRRRALKIAALGTGLADKAVILFYEGVLHKEKSDVWVARCKAQIRDVLAVLEQERATHETTWWFGETIGHADIAVACALRFVREVHPDLFGEHPGLLAHAERCEALPAFQDVAQAFSPPA